MGLLAYIAGLLLSFILGATVVTQTSAADDTDPVSPNEKPAYLVASWKILHPEQIETIAAVLDPLARKAGYTALGASAPQVLEGRFPYDGIVIVQKYRSMQALRAFWFSPAHTAAKKVREGHIDSHFVVAVESEE